MDLLNDALATFLRFITTPILNHILKWYKISCNLYSIVTLHGNVSCIELAVHLDDRLGPCTSILYLVY